MILKLDIALGARALEEIELGSDNVTSGCSSDFQKATNYAYRYVINYSMDDEDNNLSVYNRGLLSDENYREKYQNFKQKVKPFLSKEQHFKIDQRTNELLKNR